MTKVISLSDDAYEVLSSLKREHESFSDTVLRLSKKNLKKPITSFAGKWVGNDIDRVFARIQRERKRSKSRTVKL